MLGYWEILPENLTLLNPRFDAAIKSMMINSLNGMGLGMTNKSIKIDLWSSFSLPLIDLLSLAHLTPQLRKLAIYQAGFTLPPELTEKKESYEGEMEVEENEEIITDENEGDESRKKMITLANIIINLPRYADPQKKLSKSFYQDLFSFELQFEHSLTYY